MSIGVTKKELTALFLNELNPNHTEAEVYYFKIWQNPSSNTNLELTEIGFTFLSQRVQLKSYTYKLLNKLPRTSKILLQLNNLKAPFYINDRQHITFFGEEDAIMLALINFNLEQYLENFSR